MKQKENINHNGFTLLELLIVVLIIGVLAAIALPHYRRTIEKTRSTEAIMALKSITDAQERYALVQGNYTNEIDDLDVFVEPDGEFFSFSCKQNRTCQASPKLNAYPVFEFHMQQSFNANAKKEYLGKHWCMVARLIINGASEADVEHARNICKMFGGQIDDSISGETHYIISF